MNARLICHPSTPTSPIADIEIELSRSPTGHLLLRFIITGRLADVHIPEPAPPRVGDRLWEHTCCEAFLATADTAAYHELNFSPSGEWAGYAFRAYREPSGDAAGAVVPPLVIDRGDDRLALDVQVDLSRLATRYLAKPLRIGLSAVIAARDGSRSYWAVRHPPGRPDFHHADAFALLLEAPRGG